MATNGDFRRQIKDPVAVVMALAVVLALGCSFLLRSFHLPTGPRNAMADSFDDLSNNPVYNKNVAKPRQRSQAISIGNASSNVPPAQNNLTNKPEK